MRKILVLVTAALAVLLVAAPALAHVTVQPREAEAGTFSRFVVRVPTERDDASTIRVELQLPPLASVSFQPKEGWERTVTMRTLDEPLIVFGQEVTEVVGSVVWEGGSIAPGEFEEFGFSARTPDDGEVLEFPAVQVYDSGEEVRWVGPEDADEPAALVRLYSLGGEQGQLGSLATVQETAEGLETRSTIALVLAGLALLLGLAALVLALRRRPAGRGTDRAATDRPRDEVVPR